MYLLRCLEQRAKTKEVYMTRGDILTVFDSRWVLDTAGGIFLNRQHVEHL